ncbi:MAG: phosphatase PAP2 family protein [Clostridiaceae bacterium]
MELELIRTIQSISNPLLDRFFVLITILGEETITVPLLALIYWAVDKKFGEIIAFTSFTSLLFNNSVKDIFKFQRPIGQKGIRSLRLETATGYSFPSGHAQGAASSLTAVALYFKNRILSILCGILIFLIGFSRVYLGVHYPKDVIGGIIFGILIAFLCAKLYNRFDHIKVYFIILVLFFFALSFSRSMDFIKSLGSYSGFFVGILIEKKYVNFSTQGMFLRKVLRVIIGVALVLGIKSGLKAVFPDELIFHFIRYFTLTFFAIGIYPALFKKLKL